MSAATRRDVSIDGAWSEDGEAWFPRSHYTRSQARTMFSNHCGCAWIDVRVLARHMRFAPEDPAAAYWDGEYWVECAADHPDAFPVWKCE